MKGGREKREVLISIIVILILVAASVAGTNRSSREKTNLVERATGYSPDDLLAVNAFKHDIIDSTGGTRGSIYTGVATGYNGPVTIITETDREGRVVNVIPAQHNETPSFFSKIEQHRFLTQATGFTAHQYINGEYPEAVSGATISSTAIINAISQGITAGEGIKRKQYGRINFGLPEVMVILLLTSGLMLKHIGNKRLKKVIYWGSLTLALIFLGFTYNIPLTLSRFASASSGWLPDPANETHLYLLIGGSILAILITGRNVYCHTVCPFGATQDFLGVIGGAKPKRNRLLKIAGITSQIAALTAFAMALYFRNPSLTQYEVFGAFFRLTAATALFIILFIFNLLALFIKRPYCKMICPVGAFFSFIKLLRTSTMNVVKQLSQRNTDKEQGI